MKPPEFEKAFERLGTSMALKNKESGEETFFKGFLQPLRYKNKMYLGEVTTALGFDNSRKFLLITPPEIDVSAADGYSFSVFLDEKEFSCDHREIERLGDDQVYAWAVVTLVGE